MVESVSSKNINCFRVIAVLALSAFILNNGFGQEVWTTSQFLAFKNIDSELPFEENINFITNKAKGMPFVDSYEFRTETDEMDFEQQQFQFRLEFNSKDERKAYDKILSANKDRYSWMQAKYILDLKEDKYKNITDLYFLQREVELVRQEFELLLDKKTVLKKLLDSKAQIDVVDWIGNEDEIFNVRLDSIEIELQKKEIAQKIFGTNRSLPELDISNFIQIETLKNRVSTLMGIQIKNPDEEMSKADRDLADAEYQLEVAEGSKWLNFAQIEYQANDKESFQREIALGTSITLPSKRNNRVKKNDAALELIERTYKSNIKGEENKIKLLFEEAKLKRLIDQLEEFKILRNDQNLDSIFDEFSEKKIVSPLVLIGIKRSIVKNAKKQLNLEKDIYECYITILTLKAAFLNQPEINYLAE